MCTWPGRNWSPTKLETQGLMPPVPTAINASDSSAPQGAGGSSDGGSTESREERDIYTYVGIWKVSDTAIVHDKFISER
jgi:hypothetical protein